MSDHETLPSQKTSLEAVDTGADDKVSRSEPPDGGFRAWTVAIGAAGMLFGTLGYSNSFGVFQAYYSTGPLRDNSPSTIAWIGAIQVFLLLASGVVGGPLFDRFGSPVIWIGLVVYIFSIMMTSLCNEFYQFLLAQGFLSGISMGMVMTPSMAAVGQYFKKKRAASMGIVVAGSSVGGVVLPIALNKMLLSNLGFGWTVRIIGFMNLAIMLPCAIPLRPRLSPRLGTFFILTAFREVKFVSLVVPFTLLMMGVFIPIFYLPSYAIGFGMSTDLAFYLSPILNAASFFGRVFAGILADKLGAINMAFVMGLGTSILILCWQTLSSNAIIIFFAAVYGFFSGAGISLLGVCLSKVPDDPRSIGTYLGMGMFVAALGALASPPINGALVNHYGSFTQAGIFSGVLSMVGTFGLLVAKFTQGKGLLARA